MTLKEDYEEGGFYRTLVIRARVEGPLEEAKRKISGMLPATGPVTVSDVVNTLRSVAIDVRVSPSFAPVNWWSAASWGAYSWPAKTLHKEGLDTVKVYVIPIEGRDDLENMLAAFYRGFGVAVEKEESTVGGLMVSTEPVAVLVDAGLVPRRIVVLVVNDGVANAYTADPVVEEELKRLGFHSPRRVIEWPPVTMLSRELAGKMDLQRIKNALYDKGIAVYIHHGVLPARFYLPVKLEA